MKEDGLALEKAVDSGDTDLGIVFPLVSRLLLKFHLLKFTTFYSTYKIGYPLAHFFV
jgi:hypothetical protein